MERRMKNHSWRDVPIMSRPLDSRDIECEFGRRFEVGG